MSGIWHQHKTPKHVLKRDTKQVQTDFHEKWTSCDPKLFKKINRLATCDGFFDKFPERLQSFTSDYIIRRYELLKVMGGGKSGAIVLLVVDTQDKTQCLLKIYTSTFNEWGDVIDERGLREINAQCKMSGYTGFTKLRCFGILDKIPDDWKFDSGNRELKLNLESSYLNTSVKAEKKSIKIPYNLMLNEILYEEVLFMITDWVEEAKFGITIGGMDLVGLEQSYLRGMFAEIWATLENMSAVIGDDFTHWDLHPDNVFVENLKGEDNERKEKLSKMKSFYVPQSMFANVLNGIDRVLPNHRDGLPANQAPVVGGGVDDQEDNTVQAMIGSEIFSNIHEFSESDINSLEHNLTVMDRMIFSCQDSMRIVTEQFKKNDEEFDVIIRDYTMAINYIQVDFEQTKQHIKRVIEHAYGHAHTRMPTMYVCLQNEVKRVSSEMLAYLKRASHGGVRIKGSAGEDMGDYEALWDTVLASAQGAIDLVTHAQGMPGALRRFEGYYLWVAKNMPQKLLVFQEYVAGVFGEHVRTQLNLDARLGRAEQPTPTMQFVFPKVTIIDFDLVSSSKFPSNHPGHKAARENPFGIRERAIAWVSKWLPPECVITLLRLFSQHKKRNPIKIGFDYYHIFMYYAVLFCYSDFNTSRCYCTTTCDTPNDCKNMAFKKQRLNNIFAKHYRTIFLWLMGLSFMRANKINLVKNTFAEWLLSSEQEEWVQKHIRGIDADNITFGMNTANMLYFGFADTALQSIEQNEFLSWVAKGVDALQKLGAANGKNNNHVIIKCAPFWISQVGGEIINKRINNREVCVQEYFELQLQIEQRLRKQHFPMSDKRKDEIVRTLLTYITNFFQKSDRQLIVFYAENQIKQKIQQPELIGLITGVNIKNMPPATYLRDIVEKCADQIRARKDAWEKANAVGGVYENVLVTPSYQTDFKTQLITHVTDILPEHTEQIQVAYMANCLVEVLTEIYVSLYKPPTTTSGGDGKRKERAKRLRRIQKAANEVKRHNIREEEKRKRIEIEVALIRRVTNHDYHRKLLLYFEGVGDAIDYVQARASEEGNGISRHVHDEISTKGSHYFDVHGKFPNQDTSFLEIEICGNEDGLLLDFDKGKHRDKAKIHICKQDSIIAQVSLKGGSELQINIHCSFDLWVDKDTIGRRRDVLWKTFDAVADRFLWPKMGSAPSGLIPKMEAIQAGQDTLQEIQNRISISSLKTTPDPDVFNLFLHIDGVFVQILPNLTRITISVIPSIIYAELLKHVLTVEKIPFLRWVNLEGGNFRLSPDNIIIEFPAGDPPPPLQFIQWLQKPGFEKFVNTYATQFVSEYLVPLLNILSANEASIEFIDTLKNVVNGWLDEFKFRLCYRLGLEPDKNIGEKKWREETLAKAEQEWRDEHHNSNLFKIVNPYGKAAMGNTYLLKELGNEAMKFKSEQITRERVEGIYSDQQIERNEPGGSDVDPFEQILHIV